MCLPSEGELRGEFRCMAKLLRERWQAARVWPGIDQDLRRRIMGSFAATLWMLRSGNVGELYQETNFVLMTLLGTQMGEFLQTEPQVELCFQTMHKALQAAEISVQRHCRSKARHRPRPQLIPLARQILLLYGPNARTTMAN